MIRTHLIDPAHITRKILAVAVTFDLQLTTNLGPEKVLKQNEVDF